MPSGFWTEEKTAELQELASDPKLTATDISRRLGASGRGSVLGKLHRMGLNLTDHRPPAKQADTVVRPEPLAISTKKSKGACLWPMWPFEGPISHEYCGKPRCDSTSDLPDPSYCPDHYNLSIRKPNEEVVSLKPDSRYKSFNYVEPQPPKK